MSGRFVRASKYRHVHGEAFKKEKWYSGVRANYTGEGNFLRANTKFLCYSAVGGGGPVVVLNRETSGRLEANPPAINVHKGPVLDFDFNPFMDNMLATGSEDTTVKITIFPEHERKNIEEPTASLEGHGKKISLIRFHPTASNILASCAFDNCVKLWDVEKQACVTSMEFPDLPAIEWNYNGSLLGVACKDKTVKIFDPRVYQDSVQNGAGFAGKTNRVAWIDNHNKLMAFGTSVTGSRQYAVYDIKKFGDPLIVTDIDQNSGVLLPFYDPDTSVLFLGGKGDAGIKYFEIVDEEPYVHFLSEFRSNEAQKALTFFPKRACDTKLCEIGLALRLVGDSIQPVSFQVPRKSDQFQEDIFPDTYAGVSMLTAAEYLAGGNKDPQLISMKPGTQEIKKADVKFNAKSVPQLEKELDEAHKRIKELEAELAKLKQ